MVAPHNSFEIGLLRRVIDNLAVREIPVGPITEQMLRDNDFARGKIAPIGLVGILRPGIDAYNQLVERTFVSLPRLERGTSFKRFGEEFFSHVLTAFLGRDPTTVSTADVISISAHLENWFAEHAANRSVFIGCMLSPAHSPPLKVGPVTFTHLDDAKAMLTGEGGHSNGLNDLAEFLANMSEEGAAWLATVDINDCDQQRALELAELGTELALVALQVAAPYLGTKNLSRLNNRRGPVMQRTLSKTNGHYSGGYSNTHPAISIGRGYLGQIATEAAIIIDSVGRCVQSFLNGPPRFRMLEGRWCDAAYWLHQGLAEPMDSIAVAKLETSVEVLFEAKSRKGSQARFLQALDTFFDLGPDDPVRPNSDVTAYGFSKHLVEARSRILHGTLSTLMTRASADRDTLEYLAVTLVRAVAYEISLFG